MSAPDVGAPMPAPRPGASALTDHGQWRPDWPQDRPCLYWYALFDTEPVTRTDCRSVLHLLDGKPWVDRVPVRWLHLTLCDVGFADELHRSEVDRVTAAVTDAVGGTGPLEVELGPVVVFPSAIALAAGPLDRLRTLQTAVRDSTERALGPRRRLVHRHEFWPHVSLGYANREAPRTDVQQLLDEVCSAETTLRVDRVSLVSVVRRERHYDWTLAAEVDLHGGADVARSRQP